MMLPLNLNKWKIKNGKINMGKIKFQIFKFCGEKNGSHSPHGDGHCISRSDLEVIISISFIVTSSEFFF